MMSLWPQTFVGWLSLWLSVISLLLMALSGLYRVYAKLGYASAALDEMHHRLDSLQSATLTPLAQIPTALDDWDAEFERRTGLKAQ